MIKSAGISVSLLTMCLLVGDVHAAQAYRVVKSCKPADLSVHFDNGQGEFDGMSHSGAWVVLSNHSATRCAVPALPVVRLEDTQAHVLATGKPAQPAPNQQPDQTILKPHAQWRASMYWVSGNVYDGGQCVSPNRVVLKFPLGDVHVNFPARTLCGPAQTPLTFEQGQLQPVPR
ncbi:DUF4232 domain-containing protein [Acetobacter ascendens]|uniref:DUF4232 domain-containing protein n=1 Tax=Acetobacter ascendens TaxID=481146 RepID=A0A1D8QTS4_9PROT|nr:DUF4232 domain-containing protein [Acetobacter ascendens]AOW45742.1 hypothetical protein A4S02_02090 [Acetobacter ascendens]AOW50239.1 hypothetical protein A4R89_13285 [Acetobacter ascendens]